MKQDVPLVTVVTVTYNLLKNDRLPFFRQSVESVRAQDYPNIEHLVIDGASSDGTLDIIREYEQKGWLRCHSEPDKGIYDAMNKGIRLAKGKYIAFLNSDDLWHDSRGISESVKALESTGATLSYADWRIVNQDNELICNVYANAGVVLHQMPFCHQTVFTKREALLQYNGFNFEVYKSAADYDLIVRLILGGESVVYVPYNFTTFREGGYSMTSSNISEVECEQIRQPFYSYCSKERFKAGYIVADVLQYALCRVHPSVAANMLNAYERVKVDEFCLSTGLIIGTPIGEKGASFPQNLSERQSAQTAISGENDPSPPSISSGEITYKLWKFLPVLTISSSPKLVKIKLFGFLPLRFYTKCKG